MYCHMHAPVRQYSILNDVPQRKKKIALTVVNVSGGWIEHAPDVHISLELWSRLVVPVSH